MTVFVLKSPSKMAVVRVLFCGVIFLICIKESIPIDIPSHLPQDKESLIRYYFYAGFSYLEIVHFLATFHSISISVRHLNRMLRKYMLFRRSHKTPLNTLFQVIQRELQSSSNCFGYRTMHQMLRQKGYTTDRETVRMILQVLDPEGVAARHGHRLQRRSYHCPGPNWSWHIDGYDKIKPFGFAIHGCIDGFSRKILWLRVSASNNDPAIIGSYFVETVKNLNLVPRVIRADRGSENVIIGGIQRFFRRKHRDSQSGESSFRFGTSTSNQRIESWWSQFRKNRMNWWINYFKDLRDNNTFDLSLSTHLQAVRFCFTGILQKELDEAARLWNNHRIRKNNNAECPSGRPDVIYYAPANFQGRKGGLPVSRDDIQLSSSFCTAPLLFGCTDDFLQLVSPIMEQHAVSYPMNVQEAENLLSIVINTL